MRKRSKPSQHMIAAQLPPELSNAVDVWIDQQPEPKPNRSEVLRLALRQFLGGAAPVASSVRWERGPSAPCFSQSPRAATPNHPWSRRA
jgi:hypothetical protein